MRVKIHCQWIYQNKPMNPEMNNALLVGSLNPVLGISFIVDDRFDFAKQWIMQVSDCIFAFSQIRGQKSVQVTQYDRPMSRFTLQKKVLTELRRAVFCYALAKFECEKIYLSGGCDNHNTAFIEVSVFDLKIGTWKSLPCLNEARLFHSSCTIGQELYVFCGHDDGSRLLRSIEVLKLNRPRALWQIINEIENLTERMAPLVCQVSQTDMLILGGRMRDPVTQVYQ